MNNYSDLNKRIMIVEDEPVIRQVCQRFLTSEGYLVDFADNGATAEEMLTKNNYDLLLIDIKTPIISGKEFYQNIVERYPKLVTRIAFITGDTISTDTQGFLLETGRPFLLKPFSPDELETLVKESLKH